MNQDLYLPAETRATQEKKLCAIEMRRNPTKAEQLVWSRLRANRMDGYHFRRQCVVLGFIVDFYCYRAQLAIEVDGAVHESQAEYDAERDRVIRDAGILVLRVTNEEVESNLPSVMRRIRNATTYRSSEP